MVDREGSTKPGESKGGTSSGARPVRGGEYGMNIYLTVTIINGY